MRIGQFIAQRLGDRPRDARSRIDLVKRVAVPLEELDLAEAQSQNLIAIDRLQKAPQGLGVKAVGHDGQFGDRPLKPEHSKQARPSPARPIHPVYGSRSHDRGRGLRTVPEGAGSRRPDTSVGAMPPAPLLDCETGSGPADSQDGADGSAGKARDTAAGEPMPTRPVIRW